jgi:hypothetical protein
MIGVGWKLPEFADHRYRERAGWDGGKCPLPSRASGGHNTCHPLLASLGKFERHQFRGLIAADADIDQVELSLDALIERSDEVTEAAAWEYLENVQLGARRKTKDPLCPRAIAGRNDAGAVCAVPGRVNRPTAGSSGVHNLHTLGHVAQEGVGVVASGVDEADLHTGCIETLCVEIAIPSC